MGRCPAAVLSANAWHYDEPFKRWVADGAETGSLLLGVQHGGNYGIDEYAPSEDHETAITDRYYTWGWTREDVRATTTPMPAPKLMTREELPADAEAEGVLFVATVASSYPTQLNTGPERFARYLARQSEFLSALPAEVAAVMRVRPHRESLGWDIAERIADAHPEIPIESWEVPFAESMKACRVFVCDHLSTTFVEALAANKPAVLFWDPAETKVRAEAAAIFEELREAGILFDDPAAAVSAVAEAYADVVTWWRDPMRVAAVAAFRERFARTDPHAIELWAAELRGVISGE
jgi:putative transferase (TIGR04331 family)